MRTVNTSTGLTTSTGNMTGSPAPGFPIPALTVIPGTNLFYAVQKTVFPFPPSAAASRLVTIDPTTRVMTVIGPTAGRLDALAFWRPRPGPPPPSLTEIIPTSGTTLGGTQVTLHGSDFSANRRPTVTFDGILAANLVFVNSSTIMVLSPPHAAGVVDVTVTASDGQSSTLRNSYTYVTPPPVPTTVTLTVQFRGLGSGRIISAPAGIACGTDCTESYTDLAATQVQLTAIPAADAVFGGWIGDADCADGIVTMTVNRTCSARFERLPSGRPLDLNGDGRGDLVGYAPAAGLSGGGAITALLTHPGVLRAGDFNGDRRSDIFGYDPATGAWTIDLGDSTVAGTAAPRQSPLVVDVNGDGRADVVFHDPIGTRVQPCIAVPGGLECRAVATVPSNVVVFSLDLHGDGLGDLLLYRWATGDVTFLVANAGGNYETTSLTLNAGANRNVLTVDVNGDRRTDLIAGDPAGGATTLFTNTGGAFTPTSLGVLPGYTVHAANLGSSVGADLVAYNGATGQTLHALNTGGGFNVVSSHLPAGRQVAVTDLDGDRRADLVLYDPATGAVTLAIAQANGTFTSQQGNGPPGLLVLAQQSAP